MRRKILAQLTALSLLLCFLTSCPVVTFEEEGTATLVYEYHLSGDGVTYQNQDALHHAQHHPVRARCLEQVEVMHTPIKLSHQIISFVPFHHRKQRNEILIHSRPPDCHHQ